MLEKNKIKDLFKNPPKDYRAIPFYMLNHGFDETELRRQIREMDDKGLGGAILHARHGLKLEFMSEKFLDMIEVCIDEMKEREMQVWLYDENNWPSGTCDGKVTRENPQFRMRHLRIEEFKADGGKVFLQNLLFEEGNAIIDIQASQYSEKNGMICISMDSVISISDKLENENIIWEVPEGKWMICVFWESFVHPKLTHKNGYYLDTMNEEATAEFIRQSYEPYQRFKEHFGKTVKGIFTDEPGLMIHDASLFPGGHPVRTKVDDLRYTLSGYELPWTRNFFQKFIELKGYDLSEYLFALMYDIGEETNKIRLDFYEAVNTWYVANYHKAISDWCKKNHLEFMGHTLEEPIWAQIRTQGNQTKVLSQMDCPGYDYLIYGVGTKEDPKRILAAKCASSVAHIEGKRGTMCEAFGGSGFKHTLEGRKMDANFMGILGTTIFIPADFYYSFEGFRKTDWPSTEFFHAPHWKFYKTFSDYLARVSLIQSVGVHRASSCIMIPVNSISAHMFENGKPNFDTKADLMFATISDLMLRFHCDYDYVDDYQIKEAVIRENEIGFPRSLETFPMMILPGIKIISLESAMKIKLFYEMGGLLLFIDCFPEESDRRGEDDQIVEIFKYIQEDRSMKGNVGFVEYDEYFENKLYCSLKDMAIADVLITLEDGTNAEDIVCCRRDTEEITFYMIFNRTMDDMKTKIQFKQSGWASEWDLANGTINRIAHFTDNEWITDFLAGQMKVIGISNHSNESLEKPENGHYTELMVLDGEWNFATSQPNVMRLDEWNYKVRDWDAMKMEFAYNIYGYVNSYKTSFQIEEIPDGEMHLVFDDLKQCVPAHTGFLTKTRNLEIYLNREKLEALSPANWQGKNFLQARIDNHVQLGTNTLEIHTISILTPMHSLTEPVYMLGDFTVKDNKIYKSKGLMDGYWSENGYPNYSGVGVYQKEIDFTYNPDEFASIGLSIKNVREGCSIKINGYPAGTRCWAPYEFDISKGIAKGKNIIEIEVFNTLENLYGEETLCSGIEGVSIRGCIK